MCDGSLALPMLGLQGLTGSAKPGLPSHSSPSPQDLTGSIPAGPDHAGTLRTASVVPLVSSRSKRKLSPGSEASPLNAVLLPHR